MTEMIADVLGFGSLAFTIYCAQRHAWCVKHKEQYTTGWSTAGHVYYCQSCEDEWLKKYEDRVPTADC